MNREEKTQTVEELKELMSKVAALVVADYRGLSVEQVNGLRSEIRKNDCKYQVVKNTLFKLAISGTKMEELAPLFKGPTAIAYSYEDPVAPAKVMNKFTASLDKLQVKGGYLDGQTLDQGQVKDLANMKGKDELRAELLMLFMTPAQNFVRLLAAGPQNFLYLLRARERALGEG